jgi:pSer/pThr/pTyr-binding forkhead associated (FHA) protein
MPRDEPSSDNSILRPFRECSASVEISPLRLLLQPGGRELRLERPDMVLGRHSRSDIRLPLPDVSRRHCRFVWCEGLWYVFDLHSANGVYVNDQRVTHAGLHSGDTLRVGGFTFTVAASTSDDVTASYGASTASESDVLRSIADALPDEGQQRRLAS